MDVMLARYLRGATAGLLATAPMTAVMFALHRRLPWWQKTPVPPEQITSRVLRTVGLKKLNQKAHEPVTWLSHFGYGAAGGGLYPLADRLMRALPLSAALKGMIFGVLIWAGSYLGWLPAVDLMAPATEHPSERNIMIIAAHLAWGASLGALYDSWNGDSQRTVG